jgi:arginyl-tRNA synthetase
MDACCGCRPISPRQAARTGVRHASRVYNVIDARQSYLQDVVAAGLRALGYDAQAEQSIHFSYEMVALSPRCCADLGIRFPKRTAKRPYVEVSGRKGLGVKADDLMDTLIAKALEEVANRGTPEAPPEERKRVATQIAIGALRYFLLKFTRNSGDRFRFAGSAELRRRNRPVRAIRRGAGAQYLRKLEERGEKLPDFAAELGEAMARQLASEDFWQMLLAASKADSALERRGGRGRAGARRQVRAFNNFSARAGVQ